MVDEIYLSAPGNLSRSHSIQSVLSVVHAIMSSCTQPWSDVRCWRSWTGESAFSRSAGRLASTGQPFGNGAFIPKGTDHRGQTARDALASRPSRSPPPTTRTSWVSTWGTDLFQWQAPLPSASGSCAWRALMRGPGLSTNASGPCRRYGQTTRS
jgi:hypothetical protein